MSAPGSCLEKYSLANVGYIIDPIGHGGYSSVHIAQVKGSPQQYALKIIGKRRIQMLHKEQDVLMEKHALTRYV